MSTVDPIETEEAAAKRSPELSALAAAISDVNDKIERARTFAFVDYPKLTAQVIAGAELDAEVRAGIQRCHALAKGFHPEERATLPAIGSVPYDAPGISFGAAGAPFGATLNLLPLLSTDPTDTTPAKFWRARRPGAGHSGAGKITAAELKAMRRRG